MINNKEAAAAYVNAIIERLWMKGLISEKERDNLLAKNPYKNI